MCQEQGPRSAAGTRRALSRADPGGCCGRGLLLPPSPHSAPVPPVPPPPGGESRLPRPIKGGRGPAVLAAERGPIPASGRALSLGHAGKSGDGAAAPLPEPGASSVRAQGVLLLPRAQGIPPLPRAQRVPPLCPGHSAFPLPRAQRIFFPAGSSRRKPDSPSSRCHGLRPVRRLPPGQEPVLQEWVLGGAGSCVLSSKTPPALLSSLPFSLLWERLWGRGTELLRPSPEEVAGLLVPRKSVRKCHRWCLDELEAKSCLFLTAFNLLESFSYHRTLV